MSTIQRLSLVLVLLCSVMSFGQQNWNRVSDETGYGYVVPSKLYGDESIKGDFSGFNHFDIGVRYMIESNFGVKLNYGRDTFSQDNVGVSYNTINAAAVYNLGSLFDLKSMTNERLGLLGRAGFGFTFGKPSSIDGLDRIGTATVGLTPELKLNEQISLYGDIAYALQFKQHYGFDGALLNPNYSAEIGKTATFSFGLMLHLGNKTKHADWY